VIPFFSQAVDVLLRVNAFPDFRAQPVQLKDAALRSCLDGFLAAREPLSQ
jgi:hypothetical protein